MKTAACRPVPQYRSDAPLMPNGSPPTGVDAAAPDAELEKAAALEVASHGSRLPLEEAVTVGQPNCQWCEVIPRPVRGPGTVHFQFGHTHTLGKLLGHLHGTPLPHHEHGGTLSVRVPPGSLAPTLGPMLELMSPPEVRDAKVKFQFDDQLDHDGFHHVESLEQFVAQSRSEWLLDILRGDRLFSVFQPIAHARGKAVGQLFAYECLARAEIDGSVVYPGTMLCLARAAGLLFQFDLAARRAAIHGAAEHGLRDCKLFVNFTPNAIYNPQTCLASTIRMVDELGLRRDRLVFEIIESERMPELKHLLKIIDYYREQGFQVALDDVGAGFSTFSTLLALKPDYMKIDMSLTRDVHRDKAKAVVAGKLLEMAQELELCTIAEGIECAEELDWVRDHGADFVQGYYLARPATPPPALGVA